MKTKTFHASNFGSYSGGLATDSEGYVTYHDDPAYAAMTDGELQTICDDSSKPTAVRNAAQAEVNERELAAWRDQS
jgi:hypothetical protein